MKNTKKLYAGFFFEKITSIGKSYGVTDNHHVTSDFHPGACMLPEGIDENDRLLAFVIGEYLDEQVHSLIVEVRGFDNADGICLRYQETGTPLHVTLRSDGVSPVQGGIRPRTNGYRVLPLEDQVSLGRVRADFFEVPA